MPALEQNILHTSIKDISKSLDAFDVFIETGTLHGETSRMASHLFKKVYTIEVYEPLYQKAYTSFQNTNVEVILGDSTLQLPTLLPKIDSNIVFWLDGHNSGPGTGVGAIDFPLLEECRIIDSYFKGEEALILVDDVRLFGVGHSVGIDDSLKTITVDQVLNSFSKRSVISYHYYDSSFSLQDRLAIHIK